MTDFYARHSALLAKAVDACDKRYSWTAYPESPSSKIHGEEKPKAGKPAAQPLTEGEQSQPEDVEGVAGSNPGRVGAVAPAPHPGHSDQASRVGDAVAMIDAGMEMMTIRLSASTVSVNSGSLSSESWLNWSPAVDSNRKTIAALTEG